MSSQRTALLCRGVQVRFGRVTALRELDLEVMSGRITGLVGPNGAGKTTTLRLAAGLVRASRGRVTVVGVDPDRKPIEARRSLAFLPDRPQLPAHLTPRELLRLRAALYDLNATTTAGHTAELAVELGIEALLDRWCRVLSHGQAQRVALASVLISGPRLLLVDEPMTALDLQAQIQVRAALRSRADAGAAVVITTHTVSHVAALADHVVHLQDGAVAGERAGTRDPGELERWLLEAPRSTDSSPCR